MKVTAMASDIPFSAFGTFGLASAGPRRRSLRHVHDDLNQTGEASSHPPTRHPGVRSRLLHLLREILRFHFLAFQDIIINVVELTCCASYDSHWLSLSLFGFGRFWFLFLHLCFGTLRQQRSRKFEATPLPHVVRLRISFADQVIHSPDGGGVFGEVTVK